MSDMRGPAAPQSCRPFLLCAAGAVAGILLIAGLGIMADHNLGYTGMWWDEAAQFWISQGLSNYATPFATPGGIAEVFRYNRSENLDPGGFSLILHAWARTHRDLQWLRALPFVFLLLGIIGLGYLAWRLTASLAFAISAMAIPLLYPDVLYFGFEIRAYSMEMAGIVLGTLALHEALQRTSWPRAFLLGVTCALFLTSRYSFALSVAALSVVYARFSLPARASLRSYAARIAALAVPVVAVAGLVGWLVLRQQLWGEMKQGDLGLVAPTYTRSSVLRFTPDVAALLFRNVLSPAALPLTAAMVFLPLRPTLYRMLARRLGAGTGTDIDRRLKPLYWLLFLLVGGSVLVSALGYYPWDMASRWSAYLHMASALAAVTLGSELVLLAGNLSITGRGTLMARRLLHGMGAATMSMIAVWAACGTITHQQMIESDYRTNVATQIDRLPVSRLAPQSVFVAFYEVPMLRYLYEYGPYAGRSEYPVLFRFESGFEWQHKIPIAPGNGAARLAFVISAYPIRDLKTRFPRSRLRRVGPPDSRLWAIEHAKDRPVQRGPS